MGIEDSCVILGNNQEWKTQIQKKQRVKQIHTSVSRQQQFYKIQNCKYPHQFILNNSQTSQNTHHSIHDHKKCTRKHQGYHKFNICTKCQQYPQSVIPPKKYVFQRITYKPKKPVEQSIYTKTNIYKQKQVGAVSQQTPGFYNGFSLPVQKYYRQKISVTDFSHHQDIKGSIFKQKHKDLEESIYQQISQNGSPKRHYTGPIQIDTQGFQQILPF